MMAEIAQPATGTLPLADQVAALIRGRRSINAFRPEPPPREVLMEGLRLARWAPNHHLTEPWHFYLIGERTKRSIVELNAEIVTRAKGEAAGRAKRERWSTIPGWLAVTCDHSSDELQAWEDYAACACALQNLALYLWSRGIGMKWTSGPVIRDPSFYELLWIDPEIETVIGLIWYGYPDEAPASHRRDLDCSVVELP
jgi:nitroreductase